MAARVVAEYEEALMPRPYFFETEEEMECPDCGRMIPVNTEICPHCETALL